ncbi:hypothetical protein [Chitinophaga sp. 212800010-3]|uniref:hypothetical protein n=1 Tax=unclassified Chitinophaga TaxID=2619133 RepID=UPI002DEAEDE5|nr:hypothetical protein [Chitinophaga sp. 212800010-3]
MSIILISLAYWEKTVLQKLAPGSKIFLVVPVEMIRSHTTAPAVEFFKIISTDPLRFQATVMWTFEGYDDDPREVCDIPEVRRFVQSVVQAFPEMLFFMNQDEITGLPDFDHLFMLMVDSSPVMDAGPAGMYAIDLLGVREFWQMSLKAIAAMLDKQQFSKSNIYQLLRGLRQRYHATFGQ